MHSIFNCSTGLVALRHFLITYFHPYLGWWPSLTSQSLTQAVLDGFDFRCGTGSWGRASRIYKFIMVGNRASFCGWFDHFDWSLHQLCLDLCLCKISCHFVGSICVLKKTSLTFCQSVHSGWSFLDIFGESWWTSSFLMVVGPSTSRRRPGRYWKWLGIAWNGCPVGQEARRQIGRLGSGVS